jgi:hypothetical protein
LDQLPTADHPGRECPPVQFDADAVELLALPVERQGIDEFAGGNIGQKAGRGIAFGNGRRRQRRGFDVCLTTGTRVLLANVPQHLHFGRDDVELFGNVFTDDC